MIGSSLVIFIILMIIDYIFGMLASKTEALNHPNNPEYGWSSKESIIGIYKKFGSLITILAAIITDYILFNILQEIGIKYNVNIMFGLLIITWFIINELLSILEKANELLHYSS